MSLENQAQVLLPALIIGFVVIFSVLIALINIVQNNTATIGDISKQISGENQKKAAAPSVQDGIPEEVVAAIAAAVYTLYGTAGHTITSIKRAERPSRSAWATAGLLENTRPF